MLSVSISKVIAQAHLAPSGQGTGLLIISFSSLMETILDRE
jgi:hypothetical protein